MSVIEEIAAERRRQIEVEGWDPAHDDQHGNGQLGRAAAYYAAHGAAFTYEAPDYALLVSVVSLWPWALEWKKPKDARSNLIRAGALIVAEIERLDREALGK
ncbi:MAG: hypothetical protein P4L83_21095 [Nevskia sp.]|nr:hypothetical protein [Nevskia sp.]